MTARNDITGDPIRTRNITDKYRENYDRIFGKNETTVEGSKTQEGDGVGKKEGVCENQVGGSNKQCSDAGLDEAVRPHYPAAVVDDE